MYDDVIILVRGTFEGYLLHMRKQPHFRNGLMLVLQWREIAICLMSVCKEEVINTHIIITFTLLSINVLDTQKE